jgi:DNA-binding transcriptional LysR family regulator
VEADRADHPQAQERLADQIGRGPGGLRLTPEGEILLEHPDAIAERFELATAQLAAAAQGKRARLRIGALPTALAGFVPAAIARVRLEHPDARITFDEGTSEQLSTRVASGELDLAIVYEDTAAVHDDPPKIGRHHLLHERFMVALAPDHPLAGEPEVRLADLSDEDWTAALTDGVIVRACRTAGFEPNLISTLLPPGAKHPLLEPTLAALDAVAAELSAARA